MTYLFREQSVIEARHCSLTIDLLSRPDCDILRGLEAPDRKLMWNQGIRLIFSTDMAKYCKHVIDMDQLDYAKELHIDDNALHPLLIMEGSITGRRLIKSCSAV
jgi:hypothetical protein